MVNLAILKPKMYCGEHGILCSNQNFIKAVCLTNTVCFIISKDEFFDIFSSKDIKDITESAFIHIPSEEIIRNRVAKKLKEQRFCGQALADALDVNFSASERKTYKDPKKMILKNWAKHQKIKSRLKFKKFKGDIVAEDKNIIEIDSISKLNSYKKSLINKTDLI